ncbi:type VII integral membrane protein [Pectobacterium phage PPWS2]|uniref:Type VII integral membrane protein n=1 Tax=Pectobacterium phage PPWS2 TaxID=2153295 RepID=A0A3G9ESE8_9CAUD|nr:type VII integral membrane protein [Pectobacterium phage PPWS2]BBD74688.1 type VII integral membrane protein [Pectobacterium phage PPWS2]
MSLTTVTATQRQTLRDKASNLAALSQVYAESARTPTAGEAAIVQAAIDAMSTAIAVINGTSGAASVSSGATVAVRNSAGADSHNATAVVAAGALTGVNLAATVALVDNGDTITATGTGTTATLVVTAGVLTGITLA